VEDALGHYVEDQRLDLEGVNEPTSGTGGATCQRLELPGGGEYLHSERIKVVVIDRLLPGSSHFPFRPTVSV
jgi:hypothetical protein